MGNRTFSEKPYFVGLDIGTDSVGYAVTEKNYRPRKWNGEPMLGVTLFDGAQNCDKRREYRTSRRRSDRRQARVDLIQSLLAPEIVKIDPGFFAHIRESNLFSEDKSEEALYGCDWDDKAYHSRFPTIHHLLVRLLESAEGLDMRHIYLAVAWLVAHRGHFLYDTAPERVEELTDIGPLYYDFLSWFSENGYEHPWVCDDTATVGKILSGRKGVKEKSGELKKVLLNDKKPAGSEDDPVRVDKLISLLSGGKVKAKDLFSDSMPCDTEGSLSLGDPDALEAILPELGDEAADLVRRASRVYDCAALSVVLSGEQYISKVKVAQYEKHKQDLKTLKALVKKYGIIAKDENHKKNGRNDYEAMFRNASTGGYAAYVSNFKNDVNGKEHGKLKSVKREDFYQCVKSLLKVFSQTVDETDKVTIETILSEIEAGTYMPKQVNSDNRLIPYQLYYVELKAVLRSAAKVYPFLEEVGEDDLSVSDKILSVFTFRIPYYVGPLNAKSTHAWIERKAEKIFPWNFDEIVDHEKSEEKFILRMTNKCTYLPGENVLPKDSLLYTKFTILNIINNIRIDGKPLPVGEKQALYHNFFGYKGHGTNVTYKNIIDYFLSCGMIRKGEEDARVGGLDKDVRLSDKPHVDFSRLVTSGVLSEEDAEHIICRRACTEDKKRFETWLRAWVKKNEKGLTEEDIKYLSKKKYSDFGRLSEKLLNGLEGTDCRTGETGTVMHFLWNTEDNLMQILTDKSKYTFADVIAAEKRDYFSAHPTTLQERLDEMGTANAVKRPVIRTMEILSDIVKTQKHPPEKIFVEMARGGKPEEKGKRSVSRKSQILNLYENFPANEVTELRRELDSMGENANNRLQKDALFLYFLQMGKCMYCGKKLDVSTLSADCDIDHIWPQAYIKDDSVVSNKVLVHKNENGRKTDEYPLPAETRETMHSLWERFRKENLIGEEKYRRLTRATPFTDDEKQGFINRQLVETRQSTKAVTELLNEKYPDTKIVLVKAGAVSEFRHTYGEIQSKAFSLHLDNAQKADLRLVKSRTANDIHHAQDAYLNIVVGNVFDERFNRSYFHIETDKYSLNFETLFGHPLVRDPSVWNPEEHLPVVDKAMANLHIRLTKYQTCQKGGFFDENPLPAGNGNLVPLKEGMDVKKYGGYNKLTVSFFVLARYKEEKKYELTLVPCTLLAAEQFKNNPEEYICKQLPPKAQDVSLPLGRRILKINTVFSLDGFDVCLAGKTSKKVILRSLTTPWYTPVQVRYIKKIENLSEKLAKNKNYLVDEMYDGVSAEKNTELFDALVAMMRGPVFSKMPGSKLTINREAFIYLQVKEQLNCLKNMISYLKTNRPGDCDMKNVGGSAHEGAVYASCNLSNWKKNYADVRIIDRSASGLYESRSDNLLDLL